MDIILPGVPVESMIFGLDLSLTATGWSTLRDGRDIDCGTVKSKARGPERLDEILGSLRTLIEKNRSSRLLAVIEGYGFATQKGHSLGELGGLVRWHLWTQGIEMLIVPPATLKKFVTGKGVGDKGQMMVDLYKNWGVDAGDNNAADACALAIMGYHWMCPDLTAPKYRRETITKVEQIPSRTPARIVRQRQRPLQLVAS